MRTAAIVAIDGDRDDPMRARSSRDHREQRWLASKTLTERMARNTWRFSHKDDIKSMRFDEPIAIGILEEQMLTYPENTTMTVPFSVDP